MPSKQNKRQVTFCWGCSAKQAVSIPVTTSTDGIYMLHSSLNQDRRAYRRLLVAFVVGVSSSAGFSPGLLGSDEAQIVAPSPVVHAVATETEAASGTNIDASVVPTAGVLDGLFGAQPKRAKKEPRTVAKPPALPPPDQARLIGLGCRPTSHGARQRKPKKLGPLIDMGRTPSAAPALASRSPLPPQRRPSTPRTIVKASRRAIASSFYFSRPPAPRNRQAATGDRKRTVGYRQPAQTCSMRSHDSRSCRLGYYSFKHRHSTDPRIACNRIPNVVTTPVTPAPSNAQKRTIR